MVLLRIDVSVNDIAFFYLLLSFCTRETLYYDILLKLLKLLTFLYSDWIFLLVISRLKGSSCCCLTEADKTGVF